jgi:hypothetical protein
MRSIVFNVRPSISDEERNALLTRVAEFVGVRQAAALRPNAKHDVTRRMCYARVSDEADLEGLKTRIAALPEVESADIPAERGLV